MVLDYSGRRPATKNRPRKQPVGIFTVILISAVSMSFALGVLTGWFFFRPARQATQNPAAVVAGASGSPSSPQGQTPNPAAAPPGSGDPPLTFYETLPKGGKAVIGSGLNPPKTEVHQPPQPAAAPAAQHPPAPAAAAKAEARQEQGKAPAEQAIKAPAGAPVPVPMQAGPAGKFCVQIASTQERKEAETYKARLVEKGLPAYIVESTIKDRGTWFRVRVGKHLSQQAAGELAVKAGKGAMVISE
ncbi:MAG: SPOR domain-containing protein [Geobacteraceae bacterium]|nr:SPOR domain-containing protein [Geobacteraceae bacterium]